MYWRVYTVRGERHQSPVVFALQSGKTARITVPRRAAAAGAPQARRVFAARSTAIAAGTAKATVVNSRVIAPQPTQTERASRCRSRPSSFQRSNVHHPRSHSALVVTLERYVAR